MEWGEAECHPHVDLQHPLQLRAEYKPVSDEETYSTAPVPRQEISAGVF